MKIGNRHGTSSIGNSSHGNPRLAAVNGVRGEITRLVILLMLVFAPSAALAHAYLVKSTPAKRAVLNHGPAKIQLWFNERIEARYSSLTLIDGNGQPVETGTPEVSSEDPKQLSATLKALPPGRYRVQYRVLSVDGHIVKDQYSFTVNNE